MKRILIAPDKFKGSLKAKEVCQAISAGLNRYNPSLQTLHHPLADGGDGSVSILADHLSTDIIPVEVNDPLGRPIATSYSLSGEKALIEVASASGLVLLSRQEKDPKRTSTFGTGQMVWDAISRGARKIYLFLGGSATNDAAMGICCALGFTFYDVQGQVLEPKGENLIKINSIKSPNMLRFEHVEIILLCDVQNTLFGEDGAAFVYAPQKGADEKDVQFLDNGLKNFAAVVADQFGTDIGELSGGGAAGGIAAGLAGLLHAKIRSGIEAIIELTKFEEKLRNSDLVITGEGKLDEQSLQGKVVNGVYKACNLFNKPLAIFAGQNKLSEEHYHILSPFPPNTLMTLALNEEDAIKNGEKYLEELAFLFAEKHLQ